MEPRDPKLPVAHRAFSDANAGQPGIGSNWQRLMSAVIQIRHARGAPGQDANIASVAAPITAVAVHPTIFSPREATNGPR